MRGLPTVLSDQFSLYLRVRLKREAYYFSIPPSTGTYTSLEEKHMALPSTAL